MNILQAGKGALYQKCVVPNIISLSTPFFYLLFSPRLLMFMYFFFFCRTDDEQSLFENRHAFKRWYLRPRVMRPVPTVSTVCSLFGGDQVLSAPIFTSPAGVQALCHEGGESATAQACGRFGTIFGLSQHSTQSIEQVSKLAPNTNKWYQCYILKDRQVTIHLVQRAIKAGYKGSQDLARYCR